MLPGAPFVGRSALCRTRGVFPWEVGIDATGAPGNRPIAFGSGPSTDPLSRV